MLVLKIAEMMPELMDFHAARAFLLALLIMMAIPLSMVFCLLLMSRIDTGRWFDLTPAYSHLVSARPRVERLYCSNSLVMEAALPAWNMVLMCLVPMGMDLLAIRRCVSLPVPLVGKLGTFFS